MVTVFTKFSICPLRPEYGISVRKFISVEVMVKVEFLTRPLIPRRGT